MSDCLIIGGGVVGLSLAYELAGQGARVQLIDAAEPGREASWAGAGILPPARAGSNDPLEQLTWLSNQTHRRWAGELAEAVGIDNGFRQSGAIYLARQQAEAQGLEFFAGLAARGGIAVRRLTVGRLRESEPALMPEGELLAAYEVPEECQIRNPRHLKALLAGCAARGVQITSGAGAEEFETAGRRVRAVRTRRGDFPADQICLATGAWTGNLATKLGMTIAVKPYRGQMVLFAPERCVLRRIVNEGSRYLVPRDDGRVLCGSTEEDVGFDRSTTEVAVAGLVELAHGLVPELKTAPIERAWAGLRPLSMDGMPYIGRAARWDNVFVAAGHFRSGLQLSSGTAVVMSQLMRTGRSEIELGPFDPGRHDSQENQGAKRASRRAMSH